MDRKKKQKKIYNNTRDKLPEKLPQSPVTNNGEKEIFQTGGFPRETEHVEKKKQADRFGNGINYKNIHYKLPDKLSQSPMAEDKEKTEFQAGSFQKEEEPVKKKKQKNRWQQNVNYNNAQYKPPDNLSGGFSLPLDKELPQSNDSSFTGINSGIKTTDSRIKKSRTMKYFQKMHHETDKPDTGKKEPDGFIQEQCAGKQEIPEKIHCGEGQQFCEEKLFTEENTGTGKDFYNDSPGTVNTQKDTYYSTDKKSSYRKKYVKKDHYQDYNNNKKKQGYEKAEDKNSGKKAGEETGQDNLHSGFSDKDNTFKEDKDCFTGSRKLEKLQEKSEKAGKRLERAKEKLPKEKHYHWERVFNEETGKASYVLVAVETEKAYKKASVPKKAVNKLGTEGRNVIHSKIAETEKENAGVEAAHKTEQASEEFLGFVSGNLRKREYKIRKKAARLEEKKIKADNLFLNQKYIEENPDIQKKAARKKLQKERIKRRYAKAFRNGQMAGSPEEAAVKTKNMAAAIARKLQEITRVNTAIAVTAGVIFLLFIIVMFSFSSCGAMFADTFTMAGTYLSEPAAIDVAELYFTQLEMDLQERIGDIPDDYPGYDKYSYNLGEIRHDPFTFISYLSAVYTEFTAGSVAGETSLLFNSMYNLELEPVTETRTRTDFIPYTDPVTGAVTGISVETEYEVTVLKVTLSVTPLEDIVAGRMDTGQKEAFDAYMETKGALQQFYSPLDMDWHGSISSYYGYRKDHVTGQKQLHRGIDISVPEGTAVYATHNGTVSASDYDSIYGSYIVITDSRGFTTKYACLGSVYVSAGQEITDGTQVGTSGTAAESTGSHLHLEMMYNGIYYNPVFYFGSIT